jgi:hypothetical protein
MTEKFDIYDGEPWSEMDIRELTAASGTVIRLRKQQRTFDLIEAFDGHDPELKR